MLPLGHSERSPRSEESRDSAAARAEFTPRLVARRLGLGMTGLLRLAVNARSCAGSRRRETFPRASAAEAARQLAWKPAMGPGRVLRRSLRDSID